MWLLFDCGNSLLKWRLINKCNKLNDDVAVKLSSFLAKGVQTYNNDFEVCVGNIASEISAYNDEISYILLSSVLDEANTNALLTYVTKVWGLPIYLAGVNRAERVVSSKYDSCQQLGIDRWLVALSAFHQFNCACCIVDLGTAINVEFVDNDGVYQGGYIIPGFDLLKSHLLKGTKRVITGADYSNKISPGKNTNDSVNHGINRLLLSFVDDLYQSIANQTEEKQLILTGGGAFHLMALLRKHRQNIVENINHIDDLLFHGLIVNFLSAQP